MQKKSLKPLLLLAFSILSLSLSGQNEVPKIPTDYSLIAKEDYAPYETKVLEILKWLEESPIGTEKEARNKAAKFLFDWINGCPYVQLSMNSTPLQGLIDEKNAYYKDYMMAYSLGMLRFMLESGDAKKFKGTEVEVQRIGIEKMVQAYQKAKNKSRSKSMEEFTQLIKKGKLEEWIRKNVNWGGAQQRMPTQEDRKGKRT